MRKTYGLLLTIGLSWSLSGRVMAQAATPDTVLVPSGNLKLRGLLYRPNGPGPFPAVMFNHGSGHASGGDSMGFADQRHPDLLGPLFVKHGYLFLYLFRRGEGLSQGQGTPDADRMDSAARTAGQDRRNELQLQLLEGDEMSDALAGLAFLRARPDVQTSRLAVVGVSFGGSLTVLVTERDSTLKAAVAFATAGYSWERSPPLRARLLEAADRTRVPIFFIHAANDYTIASGQALGSEMSRLGKPSRVKIYPAVGTTPQEGHDFVDLGVRTWEADVFGFLDEHVRH